MDVWVLVQEIEYGDGVYEPPERISHALGVFLSAEAANAEIARRVFGGSLVDSNSASVVVVVEAQCYRLMRTTLYTDRWGSTEPLGVSDPAAF